MTPRRSTISDEFRIIPLGWVALGIIGFLAVEVLMLHFAPRWSHHHPWIIGSPWWGLITFVAATLCAAMILLTGYIYADAKRRGMQAVLWVIFIILIPKPIGYIAYFLLRKPLLEACPQCGTPVNRDFRFCPRCNYALMPACPHCGHMIARDYVFCPYCGKSVVGGAAPVAPNPGIVKTS